MVVMPPALLCFLFSRLLWLFRFFLWFYTNFRIACSSFEKNAGTTLIGIALDVEIALGSIDILTIFIPLIHKHGMFFHFVVPSSVSFISFL